MCRLQWTLPRQKVGQGLVASGEIGVPQRLTNSSTAPRAPPAEKLRPFLTVDGKPTELDVGKATVDQARSFAHVPHCQTHWGQYRAPVLTCPTPGRLQIGELMGPGMATYFSLMKTMGLTVVALVCTCVQPSLCLSAHSGNTLTHPLFSAAPVFPLRASVYAINIIFTLSASKDVRFEQLTGVQNLARLSLAPLRTVYNSATGTNDWSYGLGTRMQGLDKRKVLLVMSCLDAAAMVSILAVLVWFKKAVTDAVLKADLESITISDYSVQLHGLPSEPLTAEEVKAHLEAALSHANPEVKDHEIARVYVAKEWGVLLERLEAKGLLEEQLDSVRAQAAATKKDMSKKCKKLEEEIKKLSDRLGVKELDETKMNACGAFVTFNTTHAKDAALAAFPGGAFRAAFPGLQPPQRRFRGKHHLRAREAGDPSDILYENLHYSAMNRQLRQTAIGIFVFCLLLGTTGITIVSKSYEKDQPPSVSCAAVGAGTTLPCNSIWNLTATTANSQPARVAAGTLAADITGESCVSFVSSSGLWTVPYTSFVNTALPPMDAMNGQSNILANNTGSSVVSCAASVCQSCYCQAQGLASWYSNTNGLNAFCGRFWKSYLASWALRGMAIVFVIVSNLVFTHTIPVATRLEKFPTRGGEQTGVAVKTFLSTWFNAYVVTLLVYAGITRLDNFPLVFKGPYVDYTPSWMANIGSSLFITTFTQAVQPPLVAALVAKIGSLMRNHKVKSQYTQRDLNNLFAGPEWNLAVRAAQVLNAAWLGLIMCGMFPGVAYLLAFLFWLTYWSDKYQICRVCRMPPRYDARMVLTLRKLLVWGVWIHFGVTAWAFGDGQLPALHLHLSGSEGNAFNAATTTPDGSNGQFNVGARLEKWPVLVQGIPFLLMSTWLFVIEPYGSVLVDLIIACLPKNYREATKRLQVPDKAESTTFEDALVATGKNDKLIGLSSYDIKDIPGYQASLHALHSAVADHELTPKEATPKEEPAASA